MTTPHPRGQAGIIALTREEQLRLLSEQFAALALAVDGPGNAVPAALTATRELCQWIAPHQPASTRTLLEDLAHRAEVWQDVWPRLGKDGSFRAAVAREARLWSAKLTSSQ